MKKSHKYAIIGVLSVGTVLLADTIFATLGIMFGAEQVVLTGAAGIVGGLKLLAGS